MNTEQLSSANVGLSQEERDDLERLIRAGRSTDTKAGSSDSGTHNDDLETRAQLAERMLALDRRLNLLFQIVRLQQEKSELLTQRLHALTRSRQGGG